MPGVPLLSTLELLLFGYSNRCIRVVLIIRDHLRRIYLNCQGIYSTDCSVFALLMLKTGSFFSFFIRGTHPVCGEPLFCFSANPDSLSELCGFHIDHRSRSFLLQVSGVSSHLSFCCTSLVSGFIIHGSSRFVYSQNTQVLTESFAKITIKLFQLHNSFRERPTWLARTQLPEGRCSWWCRSPCPCRVPGGVLLCRSSIKVRQNFRAVCG